ncbi:MAG: oligosaccharide flippase family protein [Lachnospiraceae bacterium]|jgi:stage V sporulation protein B|nr:oligosaccharide flippase family protein [Lachnospiraceae bacterium]
MKHGLNREKHDSMLTAAFAALVLSLAFRIPLMSVIGAEGVAFLAPVNELFLLGMAFFGNGLSEAVSGMVRYRSKREQYKNAHRVFRAALNITVIAAFLIAVFILVFHSYICRVIFLENFSRLPLLLIVPALVFMAFTCLLRGYFQGMGSHYPTVHSLILEQLFSFTLGILFAIYFLDYGQKVAAILRDQSFASTYGAMGAALGISLAAVIAFLHLLLIYYIYGRSIKQRIYDDTTRQMETPGFLYQSLLWQAIPFGAVMVLYQANNLIDQRFFYYFTNELANVGEVAGDKATVWGNYYGLFLPVVGIFAALTCFTRDKAAKNIAAAWMREEYGAVREHLMYAVQICVIVTIPLAVLVAVLAEPLVFLLGQGSSEVAARLLQSGSAMIVFLAFSLFWLSLLKQFKKTLWLLVMAVGGLAVHIVALWLLLSRAEAAEGLILRVVAANLISFGFMFLVGFFLVTRWVNYTGDLMNRNLRTLIVTLLCSAVAGLMAMLLAMGIRTLIGSALTVLVCSAVALTAYTILMMLLRGLTAAELDRLPGGQVLVRLGRLMRFM